MFCNNIDTWGKLLLECCLDTELVICNGRFGPTSGNCTTIFESVVEYVLCLPNVFRYLKDVYVYDFNPILSDVHKPLSVLLEIHCCEINEVQPTNVDNDENSEQAGPWDPTKIDDFLDNLDKDTLTDLNNLSNDLGDNPQEKN